MNDITIDDLKNVLLDLYLSQREIARLQAELAKQQETTEALKRGVDEEV
jgi:cell division protein FtsB